MKNKRWIGGLPGNQRYADDYDDEEHGYKVGLVNGEYFVKVGNRLYNIDVSLRRILEDKIDRQKLKEEIYKYIDEPTKGIKAGRPINPFVLKKILGLE